MFLTSSLVLCTKCLRRDIISSARYYLTKQCWQTHQAVSSRLINRQSHSNCVRQFSSKVDDTNTPDDSTSSALDANSDSSMQHEKQPRRWASKSEYLEQVAKTYTVSSPSPIETSLPEEIEDVEEIGDQAEDVVETTFKELPIDLTRGETGVFDIHEIVSLLESEKVVQLCVISVSQEHRYVDYLVIGTGRSTRHLVGVMELLRWSFKQKREERDPASVRIEGLASSDWLVMDLGNIAVHLFLEETRAHYDLETLWTVGSEFDDKCQQKEDFYIDMAADKPEQLWDKVLEKVEKGSSPHTS